MCISDRHHSRARREEIVHRAVVFGEVVAERNGRFLSKSENYIYVSKFEWFWYDYGMMVWMWYDCMIVVWWFGSCVCECCERIQIEEIAKKCKTKNRLKEPQKTSLTFKFFLQHFPNTATRGFPEDLWRLGKNVFSRDLVCLRVSLCIYWRPWRAKVLFFILFYQRNIQISKSLQSLQEHHEHTHKQAKTRVKTS